MAMLPAEISPHNGWHGTCDKFEISGTECDICIDFVSRKWYIRGINTRSASNGSLMVKFRVWKQWNRALRTTWENEKCGWKVVGFLNSPQRRGFGAASQHCANSGKYSKENWRDWIPSPFFSSVRCSVRRPTQRSIALQCYINLRWHFWSTEVEHSALSTPVWPIIKLFKCVLGDVPDSTTKWKDCY